ncbi:sulfite exporter TauE/SafE family protein, partial [bacterium]|nr:sulfite exporter TauE/SafE family protein [bacterium]
VGSHLAIRKGNRFIRALFLFVLVLLIGRLAWAYR